MFYDRLKARCETQGLKLTPLLTKIGITTANTGRWKKGGLPSPEILGKLSDELDCSIDYLLGKTDDPTPADKKITSLDSMEPKEVLRQALVREGVIPADRPMTDEERNALLSMVEAFYKRQDGK